MNKSSVVVLETKVIPSSAVFDVMAGGRLAEGFVRWDRLGTFSSDTDYTYIQVGFLNGTTFLPYVTFKSTTGGSVSANYSPVILPSSWVPCARITDGDAGETLSLFAYGVWMKEIE